MLEGSPRRFETSGAANRFGHFLLSHLLLPVLRRNESGAPRLLTLGTVTANLEEFCGKVPIPARVDLGNLAGLEAGLKAAVVMIDGKPFKAGNACMDGKRRHMIMSRQFDLRLHASSGVIFSTLYAGCAADTGLFAMHRNRSRRSFRASRKT